MGRTPAVILLAALGTAALTASAAASPVAAGGPPAWSISSASDPTNFPPGGTLIPAGLGNTLVPGDSYVVTATNTGGSSSNGSTITIADAPPAGLTAVEIIGSDLGEGSPMSCELATLTCTTTAAVIPGDSLEVTIVVSVPQSPPLPLVNSATISGGGASSASASPTTTLSSEPAPFGLSGATITTSTAQAGAHPNVTTDLTFNLRGVKEASGRPKDIEVELPPGLIGNPRAIPQCTMGGVAADTCTSDMAIGVATVRGPGIPGYSIGQYEEARGVSLIYNVKPYAGEPAAFGFGVSTVPVRIDTSVRSDGDYALRVSSPDISDAIGIFHSSVLIWGVPQDYNGPGADATTERVAGRIHSFGGPGSGERVPFLANPTSCESPLSANAVSDSWENPGEFFASPTVELPASIGCQLLAFEPSLSVAPDTAQAGAPAGYHIHMHIPQNEEPEGLATSEMKSAVVTLPPGTVISPSAGNGLVGCPATDPEGFNRGSGKLSPLGEDSSDPEATALGEDGRYHPAPGHCPAASIIGTATVRTRLLETPLEGHVFLRQPACGGAGQEACTEADAINGRLYGLYLEVAGSGVVVKLEGSASVNPNTGQLTTAFPENPQVPFEDLELMFDGGPRAPLANPRMCGAVASTADLTPWSAPFTPDASLSSPFEIAGCPAPQFQPALVAGTTNNQAAAYSPFSLTLSRGDSDQQLSRIQVKTPPGLLGMLSTVALCPEPQAQAGACGQQSLVGHTTVGVGPGSEPLYVTGQVFLTGPYGGSPFGLSIVVPAVAGPFNLGTVVVRARISIDPTTSALTITSEPLPQILDGIPLSVKVVNVTVDRSNFMFNPTDCAPLQIEGTLGSAEGMTAQRSSRFQAANCAKLRFNPKFTVSTSGHTSRTSGASLVAKVAYPTGVQGSEANIASFKVDLPKQLPARLTTLQKACLSATFERDPANCPSSSVVGVVKASTPVLPVALTGPVYFVSHGGAAFPDLVIVLQGDGVRVDLTANTSIRDAITSSTFKSIPDVPISTFEVTLPEGRYSALGTGFIPAKAKGSLCATKLAIPTAITAQNRAVIKQSTKIEVTGCPTAKKASRTKARKASGNNAGRLSRSGGGGPG